MRNYAATSARRTGRRPLRRRVLSALPFVGILCGLAVLLAYPAQEALDAYRRGQVASTIDTTAASVPDERKEELLRQAHAYNARLAGDDAGVDATEIWPYDEQLSYTAGVDDAFAYVRIPKLALTMPVYHGTSDAALSAGVGHVESTSLPVGGDDTHAVLSAHSGMSGMRAFDDIEKLSPGDVFGVHVLGDWYCYRVESSETVLPDEVDRFDIQPGRDMVTLVTCVPYGVNDHRYLVHAVRCPMPDGFLTESADPVAVATSPLMLPVVGVAGAAVLLTAALAIRRVRGRGGERSA